MGISYTHYVFNTLTYNRTHDVRRCRHLQWWNISRDVTAFVQTLRRNFKPLGGIEFLRVIEPHKDWSPHVHILLHFEGALRVDNERYLDRRFYDTLQRQWKFGFSKPEVLRYAGHPGFAFNYALKYFLKQIRDNNSDENTGTANRDDEERLPPKVWKLKGKRVTYFGIPIRLLAWSRGMQHIYQKEQVDELRRKGFKAELPSKLVFRDDRKQVKPLF